MGLLKSIHAVYELWRLGWSGVLVTALIVGAGVGWAWFRSQR